MQPEIQDQFFMGEALKEAKKAFQQNEVPVGAVLVIENKVIAKGYNQVETLHDATAHAEMLCLTSAMALEEENWRLNSATLYCTIEPCLMCAGAMILTRIGKLVWGAPDLRHGANGSFMNVFEKKHPIHHFPIISGVLAEEAAELMRAFFQKRRKESQFLNILDRGNGHDQEEK